jgi:hypothetical protein
MREISIQSRRQQAEAVHLTEGLPSGCDPDEQETTCFALQLQLIVDWPCWTKFRACWLRWMLQQTICSLLHEIPLPSGLEREVPFRRVGRHSFINSVFFMGCVRECLVAFVLQCLLQKDYA